MFFCVDPVYTHLSPSEEALHDDINRRSAMAPDNTESAHDQDHYLHLLPPSWEDLMKQAQKYNDGKLLKPTGIHRLPDAREKRTSVNPTS